MNIPPLCSIEWGTVADWGVAVGTLVVAAVAIAQETIRGWFYHPEFKVSCTGGPPDCVAVPVTDLDGLFLGDSIYLRILVENTGSATAQTAEVYAKELRVQLENGNWDIVSTFPPMNLTWANLGVTYNRILPGMAKHCDVGHIVDPARRRDMDNEDVPELRLSSTEATLAFELIARPNNKTHIVGPGKYELDIQVAAENARPITRTLTISLPGTWYADENRMLRDGVGLSVT